jgi:excisionase family DNA binding protein
MNANLWDVTEVAEFLKLAVGTVYHLLSQKRIPCVRISSRCVRFDPQTIEAWVAERMENAQGSDSAKHRTVMAPKERRMEKKNAA